MLEMESSLRRLEQNQTYSSSSPSQPARLESDASLVTSGHGITLPTPPASDPPGRSNTVPQGRAEFGEVDVSENPIDGMGAINFTDEEDCGFFGMDSFCPYEDGLY